jgi:hypothetical protein
MVISLTPSKFDLEFYKNWLETRNKFISLYTGLNYVIGEHEQGTTTYIPHLNDVIKSLKIKSPESMHRINLIFDKNNNIIDSQGFVELMYQYISNFPQPLKGAFFEVTKRQLILDNNSPVRLFYEKYAQYDSWSIKQFSALISHTHPETETLFLQIKGTKIEISKDAHYTKIYEAHENIFPEYGLCNASLSLIEAAIHGGTLKLVKENLHEWIENRLNPKESLQWAQEKKIAYHPVLNEFIFPGPTQNRNENSLYTTPYLDIMYKAIQDKDISYDNQPKVKEDLVPYFEEKLKEAGEPNCKNKAKLMATFVRLPASAKGGQRKLVKK